MPYPIPTALVSLFQRKRTSRMDERATDTCFKEVTCVMMETGRSQGLQGEWWAGTQENWWWGSSLNAWNPGDWWYSSGLKGPHAWYLMESCYFIEESEDRQRADALVLWPQAGRKDSLLLGGGSAFSFYSDLQLMGWGPPTWGRAICFT